MFTIIKRLLLKPYLKLYPQYYQSVFKKAYFNLNTNIRVPDSQVYSRDRFSIFSFLNHSNFEFWRARVIKEVSESIKWTFNKYYQIIRNRNLPPNRVKNSEFVLFGTSPDQYRSVQSIRGQVRRNGFGVRVRVADLRGAVSGSNR